MTTASSSSSASLSSSTKTSSEKQTESSPSSLNGNSSTSESDSETKTEASSASVLSSEPVSDSEIESIKTYNDYLGVYGRIVNNYLDNYKEQLEEYGLADDATFQSMKEGVEEGVNQQKEAYGSMGNKKVVGKSDLVKFLKEYRDELQSYVDTLAQSLE